MKAIRQVYQQWRTGVIAVLCLCLAIWSVIPSVQHTPSLLETVQDHLAMIDDHGHSHGFEDDLLWAMHGHSHDVVDHDHNPAFLFPKPQFLSISDIGETWSGTPTSQRSSPHFRIDRPPRA